jgi:YD repeat-containing protein
MLAPSAIDRVLAAARLRRQQPSMHRPTSTEQAPGPRTITFPGRGHEGALPSKAATRAKRSTQSSSRTGINPWWRYQEASAPGDGRVLINVGTGNLLLQEDDMSVPHKGVALAFRRTYNSQSLHDIAGTDGSEPSMYGNGWTNTFDAHLSGNSNDGTLTVWDIDGAHYDYTGSDAAGWTPPSGQHATLTFDVSCGYLWTKKNGTSYYFFETGDHPATCPYPFAQFGGYSGTLYQIIGRNRNTALTFRYSWDNGNSAPGGKISAISVQAESGLSATLAFADVAGHRLLQQIVFPDGSTAVNYGYDAAGNLTSVSRPPNNAAGIRPLQTFGYQALGAGSVLYWAYSPRLNASSPFGSDGGFTAFLFAGTNQATSTLTETARRAVVNPMISDGSNSALQPGYPTASSYYLWEYYTTGGSTPTLRDTDGHATNWVADSLGRVTQTQECTSTTNGSCTGTWLVSNETWDVDNNLAIEVDPRGNETDYLYDLMGNTTAVGEPYTTTSQGSFKPTRLFDYDTSNNVTAYCDESETHAMQGDWTPATTSIWDHDDLCAAHTNVVPHWSAAYSHPAQQPYGELTSMTTPLGYTRTFSYSPSQQAGNDYGLATSVTGTSFVQYDGSALTPVQTFWYDATGYLRCYSKGQGTYVLSYDALGRPLSQADPDDSSANGSSLCGKTTGQPGWNTQTTKTYFPDGALQSSQSSAERAGGVATSFTYDVDGNPTTETHHYGCSVGNSCTAGVTTKWYDGADRLVEVRLPHDPSDFYASPWLTRYLYDISVGGFVGIAGTSYRGYGNLYKTQEWVPAQGAALPSWLDLRGSAFDGLDRVAAKYMFSPNSNTTVRATTMTYDTSTATLGLLAATTDPLGQITAFSYDPAGHTTAMQFSGDGGVTQNKTFAFDANERQTRAVGSAYGTETTHYDADGRIDQVGEPSTGSMTSPAQITYHYYPDGTRKDVTVASSGLNASPLLSYAYRADGARSKLHVGYGQPADFTWTYTNGGRVLSQSDPYTGTVMPNPQPPVGAGTLYAAASRTYDATGQLKTLQEPETLTYTYTNDDEGDVVNWYAPSKTGVASVAYTNTVRGENVEQALTASPGQPAITWRSSIANGASVRIPTVPLVPAYRFGAVIDPANAIVTATSHEVYTGDSTTDPPSTVDCGVQTTSSNYDNAARVVSSTDTISGGSGNQNCANAYDPGPTTSALYSYDAENHHLSLHALPPLSSSATVSWSPTGHAYNIGSTTIHYDGNGILFTTDASGVLSEIKVETLANVFGNGHMLVLDRDYASQRITEHDNVSYDAVGFGSTIYRTKNQSTTFPSVFPGSTNGDNCPSGVCPRVGNLQYNRTEGFDYLGVTFQGARAVDNASGQWTTPDAYAGEVHDPMSQKSFMWNRNNPYEYSDPSGYAPNGRNRDRAPGGGKGKLTNAEKRRRIEHAVNNSPTQSPGFRNGLEHDHVISHGRETGAVDEHGNVNKAKYVEQAKGLYADRSADAKFDPESNRLFLYDHTTGDVGSFNRDGSVRTYMNPDHDAGSPRTSEEWFNSQPGKPITRTWNRKK